MNQNLITDTVDSSSYMLFIISAESTIAGYELINMLRKGQHIYAENMAVYDQFYALAA